MLEHVGRKAIARAIRAAVDGVLQEKELRTRDLGGRATTAQFAQAVIKHL